MKAIVENTPKIEHLLFCEQAIIMKQLFSILHRITVCKDSDEILESLDYFKAQVSYLNESHYFHWAILDEELCVKQRGNDNLLIFVEL